MRATTAWRADGPSTPMRRVTLHRRELRLDDVAVRVDYCGVCHTDLHAIAAHPGDGHPPVVPGHEFTGVVTAVGPEVEGFAVGDPVAVGNIVDSCGVCAMCLAGQENFCREFPTLTYGGTDRIDGSTTLGAYSREYVVRDRFAYHLPEGLDPAAAAPVALCRDHGLGATAQPRRRTRHARRRGGTRWARPSLAVKLAVTLGAETTVVSRSAGKAEDARALGAQHVVNSTDPEQLDRVRNSFDVLIDTISAPHDLSPYLATVAMDGTLSHVGHLGAVSVDMIDLLIGRKKLTSAGSGGRPATAELLAFCAEHGIVADVEVLPSARVDEALERLGRNDVRYRFVLDLADLD